MADTLDIAACSLSSFRIRPLPLVLSSRYCSFVVLFYFPSVSITVARKKDKEMFSNVYVHKSVARTDARAGRISPVPCSSQFCYTVSPPVLQLAAMTIHLGPASLPLTAWPKLGTSTGSSIGNWQASSRVVRLAVLSSYTAEHPCMAIVHKAGCV